MGWVLLDDLAVTFEAYKIMTPLLGDAMIKIEHDFPAGVFPGIGYAFITDEFQGGEQLTFFKSYPYRGAPRVHQFLLPSTMQDDYWQARHLIVKRGQRTVADANVDWRIRISVWQSDP